MAGQCLLVWVLLKETGSHASAKIPCGLLFYCCLYQLDCDAYSCSCYKHDKKNVDQLCHSASFCFLNSNIYIPFPFIYGIYEIYKTNMLNWIGEKSNSNGSFYSFVISNRELVDIWTQGKQVISYLIF